LVVIALLLAIIWAALCAVCCEQVWRCTFK
jgi:hypothetical protein